MPVSELVRANGLTLTPFQCFLFEAAKRVYDLARSLAVPAVEVTSWPLPLNPPQQNITSLPAPSTGIRAAKL